MVSRVPSGRGGRLLVSPSVAPPPRVRASTRGGVLALLTVFACAGEPDLIASLERPGSDDRAWVVVSRAADGRIAGRVIDAATGPLLDAAPRPDETLFLLTYARRVEELGLYPGALELQPALFESGPLPAGARTYRARLDLAAPAWAEAPLPPDVAGLRLRTEAPTDCPALSVVGAALDVTAPVPRGGGMRGLFALESGRVLVHTSTAVVWLDPVLDDPRAGALRIGAEARFYFSAVDARPAEAPWLAVGPYLLRARRLGRDVRLEQAGRVPNGRADDDVQGSVQRMHALPDGRLVLMLFSGEVYLREASGSIERITSVAEGDTGELSVAADGDTLYVASANGLELVRVDLGTRTERRIPTLAAPSAIAFHPSGPLIVATMGGPFFVASTTLLPVPGAPFRDMFGARHRAVAPYRGGLVWVGDAGIVSVLSPSIRLCAQAARTPLTNNSVATSGDALIVGGSQPVTVVDTLPVKLFRLEPSR